MHPAAEPTAADGFLDLQGKVLEKRSERSSANPNRDYQFFLPTGGCLGGFLSFR